MPVLQDGVGGVGAGIRVATMLFLLLVCGDSQPVHISSVNPSIGSLAGGTRMHIQGSGFSNNMGGLAPTPLPYLFSAPNAVR